MVLNTNLRKTALRNNIALTLNIFVTKKKEEWIRSIFFLSLFLLLTFSNFPNEEIQEIHTYNIVINCFLILNRLRRVLNGEPVRGQFTNSTGKILANILYPFYVIPCFINICVCR